MRGGTAGHRAGPRPARRRARRAARGGRRRAGAAATRASGRAGSRCTRSTSRPTGSTPASSRSTARGRCARSTSTRTLLPRAPRRRRRRCWTAVRDKLAREPVEDLRIDFEDGYGTARPTRRRTPRSGRPRAPCAPSIADGDGAAPSTGIRFKSFEAPTRRRGLRTLALFLDDAGRRRPAAGRLRRHPAQGHLGRPGRGAGRTPPSGSRPGSGLVAGSLRFEIQVETPQSILGPDGTALVARMIHAAGRALHRPALRHLRLLRVLRHRRRPPEPRAPRRRPRQGRHAGRRRRHRRTPLRRVHQRPAGRRRDAVRDGVGATTCGWSAGRWSAASTRAGTCTRHSCRPGSPRRSRSTAAGSRPRRTRLRNYVERQASGDPRRAGDRARPRRLPAARPRLRRRVGRARSPPPAGLDARALAVARAPHHRDGRLSGWGSSWDPTGTARPRAASSGSCRDTPRHEIRDLNVSTSLRGDFAAAHVDGDQSQVLPDRHPEEHRVRLRQEARRHLARGLRARPRPPPAGGDAGRDRRARSRVEEYAWDRIPVDGAGHDHAFVRRGGEVRTTEVDLSAERRRRRLRPRPTWSCSSRPARSSRASCVDEYTTLPEADDRILATSLTATWRYADRGGVDVERGRTTTSGRCCSPPSRRRTAGPCRRRSTPWDAPSSRRTTRSRRSRSPPPTSTTSWSTSRRSASTTPARCSSPPTGPTA